MNGTTKAKAPTDVAGRNERDVIPDAKVKHWIFSPDRPYFVHDPEGDGFSYYATEEERDKHAEECIQEYLDDGWSEEVVFVMAGKITHRATQVDLEKRPDNLDEDNLDEEGNYWDSDWDYKCNYELRPIEV